MTVVLLVLLTELTMAVLVAAALAAWARRCADDPTRAHRRAARASVYRQGDDLVEPALRARCR